MIKIGKKITTLLMASVFAVSLPLSSCDFFQQTEEPADEYAVILNYNDASSRPHVVYVEKGASMETPAEPSREGYEIANWSNQQTGGTEITFPYTPTSDIMLYAQWNPAVYDVTFDYNFEGSTPYVEAVEYDKPVSAPAVETLPEYEGHYFYRWETKAEGGTAVNFPYTVKKDVTFYATWLEDDVKIYNVSFDANYEGAKEFDPIQVVGGEKVAKKELPSVSRAGYTLTGWAESPDATEVLTFPYEPTSNVTLYAIWAKSTYKVNFRYNYTGNPGGLTGIYKTENIEGGEVVEEPAAITRSGFEFMGWYNSATEGEQITFPYVVTEATNLYARWRANMVQTKIFDAEFTPISSSESFPGYSGSTRGTGIIQPDSDNAYGAYSETHPLLNDIHSKHFGHYVTYLYKNGATLTFNIYSETAVSNVVLYASLAAEIEEGGFVITPTGDYGYQFIVNGEPIDYGSIDLSGKPDLGVGNMYTSAFFEHRVATISLQAGWNVIQLVTNNDNTANGGTMGAVAPMVDYIRFDTTATLSWYPEYDNLYRNA